MPIDLNDEIVQDFLVEAGEILERLGEELVDLELRPDDSELLNAIFRGFHTVKGGAGFIGLNNLVDICHRAEDVFNLVRQGERRVDVNLMDVVLRALDTVNAMFAEIREGQDPSPAEPELMADLESFQSGTGEQEPAVPAAVEEVAVVAEPAVVETPPAVESARAGTQSDEITDEEFEALLDALQGKDAPPGSVKPTPAELPVSDEISDDEFEALLDNLHGKGQHAGKPAPPVAAEPSSAKSKTKRKTKNKTKGKAKAKIKTDPAPVVAAKPTAKASDTGTASIPQLKVKTSVAEASVRVDTNILDHIMNMVGELVLVRNRLSTLESALADEEVAKAIGNLDVVTSDLQAGVMRTRMQPIKKVFGRFPRVVRDLARSLNKEVELKMQGEDTDLDKNLVEALADPLVHLVRNAVDHGIEIPEVRKAAGKSGKGTLLLAAEQEGDHILLTIADDGAGMDVDKLRKLAVDKGIMDSDAAARLSDKECYNLIFDAGFSTKQEISDISGRGVGMDVVKNRIAQLNGSVDIDSRYGEGTTLEIKVPLTLAIVPTLMVMLGSQTFAFPLVNVSEIFNLNEAMTNVVDGQLTVMVRERPMPLFYLNQWLVRGQANYQAASAHVVVVHVGTQRLGFAVDQLLGQEEVVIKPLGAPLQGTDGLAGATITGDGHIALILDIPGLIRAYAH